MGVLTPEQLQNAHTVYSLGLKAGLPPQRAQELIYAAFRESGLRSAAKGPPVPEYGGLSAEGLMQLLSAGYRQRAQALGGLDDPAANVEAILPSYEKFWKTHPGAPPGAAAAAVEASGKPASWYAPDGSLAGAAGDGHSAPAPAPMSLGQGPRALSPLAQFALSSLQASFHHSGREPGLPDLITASLAQRAGASAAPSLSGVSAGAPDGYKGSGSVPAPGKLDSRLVALAHQYGLVITSGYRDPAHNAAVGGSPTSYHPLGEAIDVKPTDSALKFASMAQASPAHFAELFGPFPWYIKDGVIHPGQFPGHSDHVHIVLAGGAA